MGYVEMRVNLETYVISVEKTEEGVVGSEVVTERFR
jgi:hypothetical protein